MQYIAVVTYAFIHTFAYLSRVSFYFSFIDLSAYAAFIFRYPFVHILRVLFSHVAYFHISDSAFSD